MLMSTTFLIGFEIVVDKTQQMPNIKQKLTLVRDEARGVVIDKYSGLMWQDDYKAKNVKLNWSEAKSYCENLKYLGFNDWYLPSAEEFEGIVDFKKSEKIMKDGFKNFAFARYCTSSISRIFNTNYWYIDFGSGATSFINKVAVSHVRCVRKIKSLGQNR